MTADWLVMRPSASQNLLLAHTVEYEATAIAIILSIEPEDEQCGSSSACQTGSCRALGDLVRSLLARADIMRTPSLQNSTLILSPATSQSLTTSHVLHSRQPALARR
jgi:hypothetical protein